MKLTGDFESVKFTKRNNIERVNVGCGKFPLRGYTNVDLHERNGCWEMDVLQFGFEGLREVRMDHFLEHLGWRETVPFLQRVRDWLVTGGRLRVEVPDMERILDNWRSNSDWLRYLYGSQQHEGEFHKTGFTRETLTEAIEKAGFRDVVCAQYETNFPTRVGMPCLKATAYA